MSNLQREGVEVYVLQLPRGVVSPIVVSLWSRADPIYCFAFVPFRATSSTKVCPAFLFLLFSKEGTHNHWSHDNIQPSKETTCGLASPKKGGKSHDDDKMTLDDDAKVLLGHHHSLSEGG